MGPVGEVRLQRRHHPRGALRAALHGVLDGHAPGCPVPQPISHHQAPRREVGWERLAALLVKSGNPLWVQRTQSAFWVPGAFNRDPKSFGAPRFVAPPPPPEKNCKLASSVASCASKSVALQRCSRAVLVAIFCWLHISVCGGVLSMSIAIVLSISSPAGTRATYMCIIYIYIYTHRYAHVHLWTHTHAQRFL